MRLKILLRRAPFIAAFTGFALFATLLFYFIPQNEFVVDNVVVAPSKEQVSLSEGQGLGSPIRLKIPKINVDAAVEYVGLTPDGAMDVPKSQDDVAWYEPGTRPGEKGSAVIAGHYGWKGGEPSVFDSLYTLRKGDKLTIEDDKGEIITFVVRESRRWMLQTFLVPATEKHTLTSLLAKESGMKFPKAIPSGSWYLLIKNR